MLYLYGSIGSSLTILYLLPFVWLLMESRMPPLASGTRRTGATLDVTQESGRWA